MGRKNIPMSQDTYGVGIKWDRGSKDVDLDLQAVIVDDRGHIVDAVYYNNLLAMNGAVGLSGDSAEDESIWVRLKKLPSQVRLIIFIVAAYSGGSLRDISNGRVVVMERMNPPATSCRNFKQFKIDRVRADVHLALMFKRFKDDTWGLVELEEPAELGSHFLDILEPTIGDLIRSEIPTAPSKLNVAFVMDKGAVLDFPQGDCLRRLVVAVGGTFADMDVPDDMAIELQAVFFSKGGEYLGIVKNGDPGMFGVEHLAELMEEEEALSMDLMQVPKKVSQIFLSLVIHGDTFKSVESVHARVIDQSLAEIMRYDVETLGHDGDSGLIIARVLRKGKENRWGIESVGNFFNGSKVKEELMAIALTYNDTVTKTPKKARAKTSGGKKSPGVESAPSPASTSSAKMTASTGKAEGMSPRATRLLSPDQEAKAEDEGLAGKVYTTEGQRATPRSRASHVSDGGHASGTQKRRGLFGTRRLCFEVVEEGEDEDGGGDDKEDKVWARRSSGALPKGILGVNRMSVASLDESLVDEVHEALPRRSSMAIKKEPAARSVDRKSSLDKRSGSTRVSLGEVPESVMMHLNMMRNLELPSAGVMKEKKASDDSWINRERTTSDLRVFDEPHQSHPPTHQVCRSTCTLTPMWCVAEVSHSIAD